MLLYRLPRWCGQSRWSLRSEHFLFVRLLPMFVFSLKGPIHPARTTVTEDGSLGPAVQVVSDSFSALADLSIPGGLVHEIRFLLFQINYAW